MKKLLLFLSILSFSAFSLMAQDIPNASFESWEDMGTYEEITDWTSPNAFSSLVGLYTVTKEATDVYDGTYAARLESLFVVVMNVPGIITLGSIDVNIATQEYSIYGGIPFTNRPDKLKGWFKYTPNGADGCFAMVTFTKFNGATSDTIGFGMFSSVETVDTWTQFEAPITFFNGENPDTVNIILMSSSITAAVPGSVMLVDKLEMDYGVGVDELELQANTDIFFDQKNREIHIMYGFENPRQVEINLLNIMGQSVLQSPAETVMNEQQSFSLPEVQGGIYLLEVRSEGERFVKKIIL